MTLAHTTRSACRVALASVALLAANLTGAPAARADADPASDVLVLQSVFFPFQPAVSNGLQAVLNASVAKATAAGLPIKVALIGSREDLGGLPDMFGRPQPYAGFLEQEIRYNSPQPLLVVMPQGFGTAAIRNVTGLQTLLPVPAGNDGLAREAILAIERLAADSGHPIAHQTIPTGGGTKKGAGTSPLLTFGAPVALVIIVAGLMALTRGRRETRLGQED